MTKEEISAVVKKQREFFLSGATLDVKARREALVRLKGELKSRVGELNFALKEDLGKSSSESYMCETGLSLSELSYQISHIGSFSRPRRVKTPLVHCVSKSYRLPSPYGVALVMSPWNYPVLLSLDPLFDAVAAGNTVVLKTSSYSSATSSAVKSLIEAVFPPEYVAVVEGGREENSALLDEKFDYIFFTGSPNVGRLVYSKAAENMTPVTLELGGKSPCIVDETADIKLAARRIVWGKYLNLGQTCVAPDYVLCHPDVKDALISALAFEIKRQFGDDPLQNSDYGKMINKKHFDRVLGLIDPAKVRVGGRSDAAALKIEPTVMADVTADDAVMGEEIFGPVLPVLTCGREDDVKAFVRARPSPLALYVFSSDKKRIKRYTSELGFGGGCVNDTVVHLATPFLPFGGFGVSGIGSYHGRAGFETFSHIKSIVDKKTWLDMPLRYQPYSKFGDAAVRLFLK